MAEFKMPSLGADMDEGILAEWLVKPGDTVSRGQIIAVIETQKGAIDVEIFDDGVILELLVAEDVEVPVGTVLALYVRNGETEAAVRAAHGGVEPKQDEPASAEPEPEPEPQPEAKAAPAPSPAPAPAPAKARRRISPRARKLAKQLGVDLDHVSGTGPGGSITGDDVRAAVGSGERPRPRRGDRPDKQAMRQAIAAAMARSKAEIPHYYLGHTVDLEPALTWLEARNRSAPIEERMLSVTLWVRAVAIALNKHKALNGHWRDGQLVLSPGIHIGLAVSLRGGGLVNPALRDADQGSLAELSARIRDLSSRARSNALRGSEFNAATITLTNLGDRGVDMLVPIIEPPQVAIVGVGTPRLRPWIVGGGVAPRRVVELTLAADHRASDGHTGARFLANIAKLMENPDSLES